MVVAVAVTEIKVRAAAGQVAPGVPVAAATETGGLHKPTLEVVAAVDYTADKHRVVEGQMAL